MQRWGASETDLRKGTRPAVGEDQTTAGKNPPDPRLSKEAIERNQNPFSRLRKADGSLDLAVQNEVTAIIKQRGTAFAVELARKVGKGLDGRELRK